MFANAIASAIGKFSSRLAISSLERSQTWQGFGERIAAVAGALRSMGCKPGDRIAVLSQNIPEHVLFMYAVSWSGCVLVPLNTRLSAGELEHILKDSGANVLVSDKHNFNMAQKVVKLFEKNLKTIR